jgi:hypothetical protein
VDSSRAWPAWWSVRTLRKWQTLGDSQRAFLAIVALAVVYSVLAFGVMPQNVFFSGDLGMKFVLAASMARRGDLWHVAYEYPGLEFDPDWQFFPFTWLHVVGDRGVPGYVTMHMPLDAALYRYVGAYSIRLVSIVSGLGIAWLSYRLAAILGTPRPWIVSLLVGVGTPMFFYSLTTHEHAAAVFFGVLALYLVARQAASVRLWEMGLAGLAAGLAAWSRRDMYLFPVVVILAYLYVFRWDRRRWLALAPLVLGLGLVLAAMVLQHRAVYGSVQSEVVAMRTSSLQSAAERGRLSVEALRVVLLEQAELVMHLTVDGAALWMERVILALGLVLLVVSYRIDRLQGRPWWIVGGTLLFAAGVVCAFVDTRASIVVGLLPTLPLTPLGMVYPRPSREEERQPYRVVFDLLMTVNVGFLLLGLALVTHSPGQCWGPRFLSAVFPLLAILAWRSFHAVNSMQRCGLARRVVQASFVTLALLSIIVQCIGIGMQYSHKREMEDVYNSTRALETQYILTDHWVYPQYVAGLYFSKTFLRATTQQGYDTLVGRLYDHGVRQFAWLPNTPDVIDPTIDTEAFSIRELVEPVYAYVSK